MRLRVLSYVSLFGRGPDVSWKLFVFVSIWSLTFGSDSDRCWPVLERSLPTFRVLYSLYSAIRLNRSAITRHFYPDVRLYECAVVWGLTGNYGMSVTCWKKAKAREHAAVCMHSMSYMISGVGRESADSYPIHPLSVLQHNTALGSLYGNLLSAHPSQPRRFHLTGIFHIPPQISYIVLSLQPAWKNPVIKAKDTRHRLGPSSVS